MITLKDKVALVTGGGAGIGRAIAAAFGELEARVVVVEIDPARAEAVRGTLAAAGVDALVLTADVTKDDDVARFMAEIDRRYGRLDILVNNVGDFLAPRSNPFAKTTPADWDALYNINLRHIFAVTHAGIPLLRRSGQGGSIINISTIEALRGIPNAVLYSAFKTGILGFTRSLALELGPENIRVNTIAPETTETAQVPISEWVPPEYHEHMKRWTPLGRYGEPEDTAGCAVFLATDLSRWVTGVVINLDGGTMAAAGWRRTLAGEWTNRPVIVASAHRKPAAKDAGAD